MKSYTDLEQSKKLAEFLPIESADMHCFVADSLEKQEINYAIRCGTPLVKTDIPCWSLSALLDILPTGKVLLHDKGNHGYKCICNNIDSYYFNNPIDACYEMILKLHKLNLL